MFLPPHGPTLVGWLSPPRAAAGAYHAISMVAPDVPAPLPPLVLQQKWWQLRIAPQRDRATFARPRMKGWMVLGDFNGPWVETVDLKQQDGFFPLTGITHQQNLVGGLEHGFYFSIDWECHHPNWLSYFSEGRSTTNQHMFQCSRAIPDIWFGLTFGW